MYRSIDDRPRRLCSARRARPLLQAGVLVALLPLLATSCDTNSTEDVAACTASVDCQALVPAEQRCNITAECISGACVLSETPVQCQSDDACQIASCDPTTGGCVAVEQVDGTTCDDGDPCTAGDRCEQGVCTSTGPTCIAEQDCVIPECFQGDCINTNAPNLTECNDDDACTTGDRCISGTCAGAPVACDPDDEPCTVEVCQSGSGDCISQPGNDDTACDDGDPCTVDDRCDAGQCQGGDSACADVAGECEVAFCSPETGDCVVEAAPDGSTCDDGDPCTLGDTCAQGVCASGGPKCAENPDPCLTAVCAPSGACVNEPSVGAPCDDDSLCTEDDVCGNDGTCSGTAVECAPTGLPCQARLCDPLDGVCKVLALPEGAPCTDSDPCTSGDGCQLGDCVGTPTCLDDGNTCTEESCDPVTGNCSAELLLDGTACDDGDPCTFFSVCNDLVCTGGSDVVCPDDGDSCTLEVCVSVGGGCQSVPSPDGASCDDGDPCTGGDQCIGGSCEATGPTECEDDGSPCTVESCVPDVGCISTSLPDTSPCDDDDVCTTGETCSQGECVGQPVVCAEGDPCVTSGCDPLLGCQQFPVPEGLPCDDGNACTFNTVCTGGACEGDVAVCPDDGPCLLGSCQPGSGACILVNASNGLPCNDGDPCTIGDVCTDGVCTTSLTVDCGPSLPCEQVVCDPNDGCVTSPLPDGSGCGGGACGVGGTCSGGECSTDILECPPPADPCALAVCDPLDGCTEIAAPDGTGCVPTDPCFSSGICIGGSCNGDQPTVCEEDENPCTSTACTEGVGCESLPVVNGVDCTDGDPCTTDTTCTDGQCEGGIQLTCPTDNNECTDDACVSGSGCVYQAAAPGTACDDGNACTESDECLGTTCDGFLATTCPPSEVPCTVSFCDAATGQCATGPSPDGITCDDGNPCTQFDQCLSGQCGGAPVSCEPSDSACLVATCDPATGGCALIPATSGQACNDGNLCTADDQCDGQGTCAGAAVQCPGNPDACQVGLCVLSTGECEVADAANNAACDDGDPCTTDDYCLEGQCINGPTPTCDDDDPCTAAFCNDDGTCSFVPFDDGDPCEDGDFCTVGETCNGGTCAGGQVVTCPDTGDGCAVLVCDSATGLCDPLAIGEGDACDDGNACTSDDTCTGGECAGTEIDCADSGDPCAPSVCDASSGSCAPQALADGTPCDDVDLCTENTVCQSGQCVGSPLDCDSGDDCQIPACEPALGCTFSDAPDGLPCATATCYFNTTCLDGGCVGGTEVTCIDPGIPCATPACVDGTGCTTIPAENGSLCDDGDLCTTGDVCADGDCVGGDVECPAPGVCQVAFCDAEQGCVVQAAPVGTSCDDGDACTGTDQCTEDGCEGAPVVTCIGTDCNPSACDPESGVCVASIAADGEPCDDGSPCLVDTTCDGGTCTSETSLDCPETDSPCTTALCVESTGACVEIPLPDGTACDDDDACTTPDRCVDSECVGTSAVACPQPSGCFVQVCDPNTGTCSPQLAADGAPCDDGDGCTAGDTCSLGACVSGAAACCVDAADCADGDICTADACDAGVCTYTALSTAVCSAQIAVASNGVLSLFTDDGTALPAVDDPQNHDRVVAAPDLGLFLLVGADAPAVYEPRTATWSLLLPAPAGLVTAAAYHAPTTSWVVVATDGTVTRYDALSNSATATIDGPSGSLGTPAVDTALGRVFVPTNLGFLAVYDLPSLTPVVSAPWAITGTPTLAVHDGPRARLLVSDPAANGTRVIADVFGYGLPGDTLAGIGAPTSLDSSNSSDLLWATYPDADIVRAYSLSTLQPTVPPAVALATPSRVRLHAGVAWVLSDSGQLSRVSTSTMTPLGPALTTSASAGDLAVLPARVPELMLSEVERGDGWIELRVSDAGAVNGADYSLATPTATIPLMSLGVVAAGSFLVLCHPSATPGVPCDLTSADLSTAPGQTLTVWRDQTAIDYLTIDASGVTTARRHPSIDGRRPEARGASNGTPGASNTDVEIL